MDFKNQYFKDGSPDTLIQRNNSLNPRNEKNGIDKPIPKNIWI